MARGVSNGHVTEDVTWPPKGLWGSMVGYPSDSLAFCKNYFAITSQGNLQCKSVRPKRLNVTWWYFSDS